MPIHPHVPANKRSFDFALTIDEVAEIMTQRGHPMRRAAVWKAELRALKKMAADPAFRQIAIDLGWLPSNEH